ncbi:hypothetical protein GW17_00027523 [Ensete ventricosum]|nr:hypothetical protein GW17_00027523 [Ensete ventricosum]
MEELSESDVMWPDGHERRPCDPHKACSSSSRARTWTTSAPVAIPRARGAPVVDECGGGHGGDEERETELVPPHVLASRGSHRMSSSLGGRRIRSRSRCASAKAGPLKEGI